MSLLKDLSLVTHFDDIDKMDLTLDLKTDFNPQNDEAKALAAEDSPKIEEYYATKAHGSDVLKCYPLSYFQANLSYYHIKKL